MTETKKKEEVMFNVTRYNATGEPIISYFSISHGKVNELMSLCMGRRYHVLNEASSTFKKANEKIYKLDAGFVRIQKSIGRKAEESGKD